MTESFGKAIVDIQNVDVIGKITGSSLTRVQEVSHGPSVSVNIYKEICCFFLRKKCYFILLEKMSFYYVGGKRNLISKWEIYNDLITRKYFI